MAELVRADAEAVQAVEEMVGRQCQLWEYKKITIPAFQLKTEFIAYSSPDSTYALTEKFFNDAKKSILIGIYDFTAGYMEELLLKAMQRGVKVSLMLDIDNRTGETEIFDNLKARGCEAVPSPSCASQNDASYFASSHEKVIVIDDEWVLVQSGNYSDNSIPQNANPKNGKAPDDFVPGNRDMGVAIKSKELSAFFATVLRADMQLELRGAPEAAPLEPEMLEGEIALYEAAPSQPPEELFEWKQFVPDKAVTVQPILSPDNYMDEIPKWLRSAKKSVYIEQQYIRGDQDKISECMNAIVSAREASPDLDVRIILAKPFPGKRFDKEAKAIKALGKNYGTKLNKNVRILSPKHFVHCHNKLIIVDEEAVLISSQNWSDAALVKNREAGVVLHYPAMAKHYTQIFESDWKTAEKTLKKKTKAEFYGPESFATGKTVRLNPGDYVDFGDDDDFEAAKKVPAGRLAAATPKPRRPRRRVVRKPAKRRVGVRLSSGKRLPSRVKRPKAARRPVRRPRRMKRKE